LDVSHDRPVFSKTAWGVDIVQGVEVAELVCDDDIVPEQLLRLGETAERMALFYARRLVEVDIDREKISWYHQRMLEAFDRHLELTRKGQHRIMKQEWLEDTAATMDRLVAECPNEVELEMLKASGESLARVVRGEMHMLEILKQDDLLSRFYMENGGFIKVNQCLARAMQQISFKFPRCTILEIGAGTGATVCYYISYNLTDVNGVNRPGVSWKPSSPHTRRTHTRTSPLAFSPAQENGSHTPSIKWYSKSSTLKKTHRARASRHTHTMSSSQPMSSTPLAIWNTLCKISGRCSVLGDTSCCSKSQIPTLFASWLVSAA
jgi:hypothetical protein